MVHSVILLEERSGTTVGLIEQTRWCREKGSRGKRHKRKERAYEDKESFKWERASRRVTARLGEVMGRVISVCDREADCCQPDYLTGYFPIYVVMGGHRFPRLRHR